MHSRLFLSALQQYGAKVSPQLAIEGNLIDFCVLLLGLKAFAF